MADLNDLAVFIERIKKSVPLEADRAKRETAGVILEGAVEGTPVDTSKALSNWQVGVGNPVTDQRGAVVKGKFGTTQSASASATIAEGQSKLKSPTPKVPVFVSNHLEYIEGLNNGSISNQAGAFVELALLKGKAFLKTFKFRLSN